MPRRCLSKRGLSPQSGASRAPMCGCLRVEACGAHAFLAGLRGRRLRPARRLAPLLGCIIFLTGLWPAHPRDVKMSDEEAAAHRAPGTIVQKAESFVIVQRGVRRIPDHFRLAVFFGSFFERKSKKLCGRSLRRTPYVGPPLAEASARAALWRRRLVQVGACDIFLRTFGLTQKYQKVKHGEKLRVSSPALAERARKTALFAAQKDAPLRLWRLGKARKRPLPSPVAVVCTPAPGARAVAATFSALFAVRSCRPKACKKGAFRPFPPRGLLRLFL